MTMWITFVLSIIAIPLLYYYDNRQISESDLSVISELKLSQNASYLGGKRPRINIYLLNTERTLVVNHEELHCVIKHEILNDFKKGDIISIKILQSEKADFYEAGFVSGFQKIYGLSKNGKEYIQLGCRNTTSSRKTMAAIYASTATAFISLILAVFIFKSGSTRQIKLDPILMICIIWLVIMIVFTRK